MVVLKTYYLRVSVKEVILVEIRGIENCVENNWLQERHLQEIIQLLHPTVTQYIDSERTKKTSTSGKQQQKPSDILTGSTVRFGYSFKTRPGRQTCLFEDYTNNEDCHLSSFHVMKEKIIVYAHPLIPGSPAGMSQLMKVLKRKSVGQGVSISSYFQKLPSQTASQSQSESQSRPYRTQESQSTDSLKSCETQSMNSQTSVEEQCERSVSNVLQPPPSEGRRHKIQSILERGDIGLTKRQKKTKKYSGPGNEPDREIDDDDDKEVEPGNVGVNDDMSVDSEMKKDFLNTSAMFDNYSVTPCDSPLSRSSKSSESFMIGNIKVDRVDNPGLNLADEHNVQENTVTLISVEQVNDIKKNLNEESEYQFTPPSQKHVNSYLSDKSKTDSQSSSPNENLSEPNSDTSDDVSILPSASFCTRTSNRRSRSLNVKEMKKFMKSKLSTCEKDNKSPDKITEIENKGLDAIEKVHIKSCDGEREGIRQSNAVKDTATHKGRLKRKFPKFSDSDLEESLPGKKQRTKDDADRKFVNLNNMNSNTKKLNISKSFMVGDGGMAQPTLSFFVNKSSSSSKTSYKSETLSEGSSRKDEETDAGDTGTLNSDLSEMPMIKNEADLDLKEEINAIISIGQLNEQHLEYLVRKNETYLRQIFEGKSSCERHMDYKTGGSKKRGLNHRVQIGHYSEDQIDAVMQGLIAIFCKRHNKYLDYIMKVLLPEMLVKLHMDIHGTSHAESERMMSPSPEKSMSDTP